MRLGAIEQTNARKRERERERERERDAEKYQTNQYKNIKKMKVHMHENALACDIRH